MYIYINGFGINKQQWLMCHKTKTRPNQTKPNHKSFKVSRNLPCILADLDNAVFLILPLISNSSSLFSKPLGTVSSALTPIGVTANHVLHSFIEFSSTV